MKKTPLVSIIVSNYNGKKYLKKCFDSLLNQTYSNIELILSDDFSTDGSIDFMKDNFPSVKLAVNPRNSGLSVTSNNGAKLARGKYMLFYNNDTISFPSFVEELVKVAEENVSAGIVCPTQLPYLPSDDNKRSKEQKELGAGSDIYGYVCLASWSGHIFYPDAAIFMRANVFKEIGGFDPDFFLYGEDMDLCWRVHLLGYTIIPAPRSKFRHDSFCAQRINGKIQTTYKRRFLVERQVINKLFKYYTVPTLLYILPRFFLYYFSEAFFFLVFRLNFKMFFSVYIRAILWNLVRVKTIYKNRKVIQSKRRVSDSEIMNLMYPKYTKLYAVKLLGIPLVR